MKKYCDICSDKDNLATWVVFCTKCKEKHALCTMCKELGHNDDRLNIDYKFINSK